MPGEGQSEDDHGEALDDDSSDGSERHSAETDTGEDADTEESADTGGEATAGEREGDREDSPEDAVEGDAARGDAAREVSTEPIDPASEDLSAREPGSGETETEHSTAQSGGATETASATGQSENAAKGPDEVFCSSCGEPIKREAEICPNCGVRQDGASVGGAPEKNPGIAAIASFFFPGLGDVYNGEFARGAVIFVGWFVGGVIWAFVVGVVGILTLGIGLLAAPLYALVNFVSAYLSYKRAERINAGEIRV